MENFKNHLKSGWNCRFNGILDMLYMFYIYITYVYKCYIYICVCVYKIQI